MTKFSDRMISENLQVFWAGMRRGEFITDAAGAGSELKGRCLSFTEREEMALGLAAAESLRSIAGGLGRSPSTICRELARNRDPIRGYPATTAHALSYH